MLEFYQRLVAGFLFIERRRADCLGSGKEARNKTVEIRYVISESVIGISRRSIISVACARRFCGRNPV